jgi:hypothetical protein
MKPLALAIPSFERRIPRDENWLAERGGLETAVSRETRSEGNPARVLEKFRVEIRSQSRRE